MHSILTWWMTPVLLYIALAFGLVRWMGKKYIVGDKRTRRLFVQYLTCLAGVVVWALVEGHAATAFSATLIIMWFVGAANGIACFYNWKAQDLSMGKTSVFTIWDDVIAMTLSYVVLSEGRYLNSWSGSGILLSIVALLLFGQHAYRAKLRGEEKVPVECFYYVGVYSVLWGVALFTSRYYSDAHIPFSAFGLAWYGGSVIAAAGLLVWMHEEDPKQRGALSLHDIGVTIFYSLLILLCLVVGYWSYRHPQTVVQPIYFVAEALVPTAIGFWFFGEKKQFDPAEYFYLALAIVAVLLIFVGYHA